MFLRTDSSPRWPHKKYKTGHFKKFWTSTDLGMSCDDPSPLGAPAACGCLLQELIGASSAG